MTFAERKDVMEDNSDEADDIPTIKVGGEEYEITDVTHEIIAKMTTGDRTLQPVLSRLDLTRHVRLACSSS